MNPDNTFHGAYLKAARAAQHINELIKVSSPLHFSFYDLVWKEGSGNFAAVSYKSSKNPDPEKPMRELTFVPKASVSQNMALFIGDVIHNLRASLDYAATAVIRAAGGNTQFVTFPFHETRDQLQNVEQEGIKRLQDSLPNADVRKFFVDQIRPYNGGNTALWALTKLDKIDKHNFVVPTVTIVEARHENVVSVNGINNGNNLFHGNADREMVLYSMPISEADARSFKVRIIVNVDFPVGKYFSGLPVIPTLQDLHKTVYQTLCTFEDFCVAHGAAVAVQNKNYPYPV